MSKLMVFTLCAAFSSHVAAGDASRFLVPGSTTASRIDDVFSRTISYRADGFPDLVFRVSGTASYRLVKAKPDAFEFDLDYRYDGRPDGHTRIELSKDGSTQCTDGKCSPVTDASGLLYNSWLWGSSSGAKSSGWNVVLAKAWELGPPGVQHVTVIRIDAAAHAVTLQRQGSGDGFYVDDRKQEVLKRDGRDYKVDVVPGTSQWSGVTEFIDGIVQSDELVVERPVVFKSDELGSINGTERQYILLNRAPVPTR